MSVMLTSLSNGNPAHPPSGTFSRLTERAKGCVDAALPPREPSPRDGESPGVPGNYNANHVNELTGAVSRQYDLFQTSLESLEKPRKYLNYGYTVTGREIVRRAAGTALSRSLPRRGDRAGARPRRRRLRQRRAGFPPRAHVSVREAHRLQHRREAGPVRERARDARVARAQARVPPWRSRGAAGHRDASVDRVMAIECAFYFDRPRFYQRAAEVLKPGGLLVLADIAFAERCASLRRDPGTTSSASARARPIARNGRSTSARVPSSTSRKYTRPGAQMTVTQILKTVPRARMSRGERREWLKMAHVLAARRPRASDADAPLRPDRAGESVSRTPGPRSRS